MAEKKIGCMRKCLNPIILLVMLCIFGIYPVTAGESYDLVQSTIYTDSLVPDLSQDLSMFSPSTGYLVVQNTYDIIDYPLNTGLFTYDITWKNESDGTMKFTMDIKSKKVNINGKTHHNILYGTRNVYINGTNYIFSHDDGLIVDTFSITPGPAGSDYWNANWGTRYSIDYNFDGPSNMDNFQVVGGDSGIYLVAKHTEDKDPYLEISFIPIESLESTDTKITPQLLYKFKNSDSGFHPVPDTKLYDTLVTQHMDSGKDVIIGAGDYDSSVLTWYIGPDGYGNKTLVSKSSVKDDFNSNIGSVILQEGNCPGAETEANGISALVFADTRISEILPGNSEFYNCDLPTFASNSWNKVHEHSGTTEQWMGEGPISAITASIPIPSTNNLWSIVMYAVTTDINPIEGNFFLTYYASNQLLQGSNPPKTNTDEDISTYGNLLTPVGIIDGVVPLSLNGNECDSVDTISTIKLNEKQSNTTKSASTEKFKTSVSYGHEFFHDLVGIDTEYAATVGNTQDTSKQYSTTVTASCELCTDVDEVNGTFLYVAPNLITYQFSVADFYGNVPTTNPQVMYLTMIDPDIGEILDFEGYNLTNPSQSGVLKGALASPVYDDFSDWNWTTMSGGWYNRNWEISPYSENYTVENIFSAMLHWSPTTKTIPSADSDSDYSQTNSFDQDISTSAKIFGLSAGESVTLGQENTIQNAISQAIEFEWGMKVPESGTCGITDLKIEPFLLTPKMDQKNHPLYCPWVPDTFANYTPWFLTFNVLNVNYTNCYQSDATPMNSKISTNALPKGAGTIMLPSGGIAVGKTGTVTAIPSNGYTFLHWKGYGIDLDNYSSPVANATVVSQLSTLRAYFGKKSNNLVQAGMILIQNSSTGNQIKIQGTLPDGFNYPVAMDLKQPIEISIGSLTFPFGATTGDVTVVSDHEIAYTTTDPQKGISNLRVDFGTNTWWFTANQVHDLGKYGIKSNIVNIGIRGKNVASDEDVLMAGEEGISWSGKSEPISNKVFSLQNATFSGQLYFLNDNTHLSTLSLNNAYLNVKSLKPTDSIMLGLNDLEFGFSKPTSISGSIFTYLMTSKDLNTTITVNNQTMMWDAVLDGERLSHDYLKSGVMIGLKVGDTYDSSTIHPGWTTSLKTPNIASSSFDDGSLSGMNSGV